MGLLSHILTFGAGVAVGMRLMTSDNQDGQHWVKINTEGIKIANKDIIKINEDNIDIAGYVKFERKSQNRD